MTHARFPVAPGDTVTAWALGPLHETEFHGPAQPMEDRVDYRFVNGWVDVGDLPCRLATWEEVRHRPLPPMPEVDGAQVNLPGFNRRLDFTGFWHIPHRLRRAARTRLIPQGAGPHRFRIGTCGGLHLWVDGQHVTAFEPFTRNAMQETEVTLPLRPEGSEVVIALEEMAERDTNFFLELTWLGTAPLMSEVPGEADPDTLDDLMRLAREVRPAQVAMGSDDALRLVFDSPPARDVTIKAHVARSVHLRHLPPLWSHSAQLAKGTREIDLGRPELGPGYHPLTLSFEVGDTRLTRSIAFARLSPQARLADTLAARKAQALEHAATEGEARIGRVLARMALGHTWSDSDSAILDDTLTGIERRRDCSDFVMVPLLWLLARHADRLPADAHTRARQAVLGYRYWMTEPGNDAMWFWSENHVLCFHVSQLLAGQLYPEAVFANANKTGATHHFEATSALTRWFDAIEADGLAEWNSAAYYPIDFIGLLALAELAEGEIRRRARALLDQLFTMIALHSMNGTCAGSMGRAYDKELRAGPLTELSPFAAVAFGTGWLTSGVAALPMFCLTDYAPPEDLAALVAPPTALTARYVQGHGDQGRLALAKTAHGMISACVDGTAGATGHQQHLVDLQFRAPFARVWVNHPGEDDPWGANRPSYWAGNGVMPRVALHEATALMLFDGGRLPFTHAYAPLSEFDQHIAGEDFLVLVSGQAAAVLKATGPIHPVTDGPGAGLEWRVLGLPTGWALSLCDLPQGGATALADHARTTELHLTRDATGLGLSLMRGETQLHLNQTTGLSVNGTPCPFPTSARAPQITHLTKGFSCR